MQISRLKSMFAQVSSTGNVAQAPPPAGTPTLTDPISQSCMAYQFHEEAYAYWCQQIGEKPRSNGKEREFCYVAPALSLAGVLTLGRTGLGLGVGAEPPGGLFAARGAKIVGTDLEPEQARTDGWIDTDQHASAK